MNGFLNLSEIIIFEYFKSIFVNTSSKNKKAYKRSI